MDWGIFLSSVLAAAVRMGIPIAFAGIGVVIAEKCGVLNIGCEGEMLIGSFTTFAVSYLTGSVTAGVIAGGIGGMMAALVIAYLSISRRQDQSVVGIVLNIFAAGFTSYLYRVLYGTTGSSLSIQTIGSIRIPILADIPVIGEAFFNQTIFYYLLGVVAVISWYVLTRLKVGLQLKAVGENPRAAQACGINVILFRYAALAVSGFLSGIGGSYLIVAIMGKFTEDISAGRGFIAMAVSALCHWNPLLALLAAFVFGAAQGLQMRLQSFGINVPYQFLLMLPYAMTLISLIAFGRGVKAPRDLGCVYEKEGR